MAKKNKNNRNKYSKDDFYHLLAEILLCIAFVIWIIEHGRIDWPF
ncbi:hypothetical protein [Weissella oryzae]|nr:hypothetical protein [Weissella oryzae]